MFVFVWFGYAMVHFGGAASSWLLKENTRLARAGSSSPAAAAVCAGHHLLGCRRPARAAPACAAAY